MSDAERRATRSATGTVEFAPRPPVRQSALVRSGIDHTFTVFVREIAGWWPVLPFSRGGSGVVDVTLEPWTGGRRYETRQDGTTSDRDAVLAWRPPESFTVSWNMTGEPTEVELVFVPEAPASTRVTLEHRGWGRLSLAQLRAACALPGGYAGGAFAPGWAQILAAFVRAAGRTPHVDVR